MARAAILTDQMHQLLLPGYLRLGGEFSLCTYCECYGAQAKKAKIDDWSALLSEREQQVARLVARGSSNREVAEQLSISERTAKAHLTSIFDKLGLRDRLQLSLRINGLTI